MRIGLAIRRKRNARIEIRGCETRLSLARYRAGRKIAEEIGLASDSKNPSEPDKAAKDGSTSTDKDSDRIDIGDALRSAYEDAVKEDIPTEMIDLLGKLD